MGEMREHGNAPSDSINTGYFSVTWAVPGQTLYFAGGLLVMLLPGSDVQLFPAALCSLNTVFLNCVSVLE
jgi:hypothetical protein